MAEQAKSWTELKIQVDSIDKAYAKLSAPPRPNDGWTEKVNAFHRVLEGMREQVRTELEMEDLAIDRARENE